MGRLTVLLALCLWLKVALAGYSMDLGDLEIRWYYTGTTDHGKWKCLKDRFPGAWNDCANGTFTCDCPSGGIAEYTISCDKITPIEFPAVFGNKCGKVYDDFKYDCTRFQNCANCTDGSDEDRPIDGCAECEPGYEQGSEKDSVCEDMNPCGTENGGCHPEDVASCTNIAGSSYCTCAHGYVLMEDGLECNRLACPTPTSAPPMTVEATESWLYASYAKYSCMDKSTHALIGSATAECLGVGDQVMWSSSPRKCSERCKTTHSINHCGLQGISEDECKQRDCCFEPNLDRCEHSEAQLTLLYEERRPVNSSTGDYYEGSYTQEQSTIAGCGTMAVTLVDPEGKAFGIHHLGYNVSHDVMLQDCHVFEMTMAGYEDAGEMGEADDFDFYDMLEVQPDVIADNRDYHDLEKILEGCYLDDDNDPDLDRVAWSRNDNTVSKCIAACRQQNFRFAGLQNGGECHCGSSYGRHGNATVCDIPCTGAASQTCGGAQSNSIYPVPYDHRYVGCYKDNVDTPDLPEQLWDKDSGKSASQCIDACMLRDQGYDYAGVQDGGACFCGYAFGRHGDARETDCDQSCGESSYWGSQNCGGEEANAIYNTELTQLLTSHKLAAGTPKIHHDQDDFGGITTRVFSLLPHLKSIVSKRLVIHATEVVATPVEDQLCADNCYEPCGDVTESEVSNGATTTLRIFHINLRDLHLHIGPEAQSVKVYAQSVVIDEDVHVEYSLQVRTRQLFIDRSTARWITASIHAPDLDMNFDKVKEFGPEPDSIFQDQSLTCAQTLLDTQEDAHINTAWAIRHYLARDRDRYVTETQEAFVQNFHGP